MHPVSALIQVVQEFAQFSEPDKRNILNGAVFLVGLFVLATYFCLKWDK